MLRSPNSPAPNRFMFGAIDRARPPGHHQAQQPGRGDAGAPRPRPSLIASQRVRVTLWVQASRCVPFSNSRVISGAPQNAPISAGTATSAVPMSSSSASNVLSVDVDAAGSRPKPTQAACALA